MNCPECDKIIPITKIVKAEDDAVSCVYCNKVVPSEYMVWKDNKFHFNIIGDVVNSKASFAPRMLMQNQRTKTLDIRKLLATAKKYIRNQPNISCICGEFMIRDSDIRLELLIESEQQEEQEEE